MARGKPYQPRAKIICTIGPATARTAVLARMLRAGMNVARLNLSHVTFADHAAYIGRGREASAQTGRPAAILTALPGPKYRIGRLADGQAALRRGQDVRLTSDDITGDQH